MTTHSLVNSVGLVCDIVGALLLWRFGLPEAISRSGTIHVIVQGTDASEQAKAKRYDGLARLGVALLVCGFALQLVSNFL